MDGGPRPGAVYARIGRTYARWLVPLTVLGLVVFVPLGLLHAIVDHADLGALELEGGPGLAALALALSALAVTGLLGEVFYTGAVSISLTHPHDGRPPSLRETAGMISYGTLIAVDVTFGLLVAVGAALFLLPGIAAYVWLGLAAPAAEIEGRGWRDALRRSVDLVRGHFWLVAAVLVPIEVVGGGITALLGLAAVDLLGDSVLAEWVAHSASNVLLAPFYAVAAVVLTLELVKVREGSAPQLHPAPSTA